MTGADLVPVVSGARGRMECLDKCGVNGKKLVAYSRRLQARSDGKKVFKMALLEMYDDNNELFEIKLRTARSQLGTAMELYLRDRDPISIQVLACGAAEIIEKLVDISGKKPISNFLLNSLPHLDLCKFYAARNLYWNAFKHLNDRNGKPRKEDVDVITNFTDKDNDAILFTAWFDYMQATGRLPVSAQVFQLWFYALKPDKLDPYHASTPAILEIFPNLNRADRKEQKRRLNRTIERYRNKKELISDPRTEPERIRSAAQRPLNHRIARETKVKFS